MVQSRKHSLKGEVSLFGRTLVWLVHLLHRNNHIFMFVENNPVKLVCDQVLAVVEEVIVLRADA